MQFLLNTLHEEFQSVFSSFSLKDINNSEKPGPSLIYIKSSKDIPKLTPRNPFEGLLKNTIQCCQCKRVSPPSYQNFTDLSLSIPMDKTTKHISLEDCLKYFTSSETVQDVDCSSYVESPTNMYQNSEQGMKKCFKKSNSARKKLSIARAPTILCLHIRRLVSTERGFTKLSCHIKFPLQFDLAPYCSFDLSECAVAEESVKLASTHASSIWPDISIKYKNPPLTGMLSLGGGDNSYVVAQKPIVKVESECNNPIPFDHDNPPKSLLNNANYSPILYNLVSIVEHSGNNSGGHFTTYRKDLKKQNWLHISDERVANVEDIRNANAYILFYEKI